MADAPYPEARDDPSLSSAAAIRPAFESAGAVAPDAALGAAGSRARPVRRSHHSGDAYGDRGIARYSAARQYRDHRSFHARRESAHDPAHLLRSLSHRLMGAAP